ncbi:hypothetical protein DSO57_1018829 [Entomophthora muscae]|uniref:Uncharacterized protein n=1 Tax=Entomophthora muscae TaxID=34485 RepID=A0ACC2TEY1_9FUNG|nr:hypothetical protein DSO57_1018829 [Entomophthora muscae]
MVPSIPSLFQKIPIEEQPASNQPLPDLFLLEKDFEEDSIHKLVADNLYVTHPRERPPQENQRQRNRDHLKALHRSSSGGMYWF